MKKRIISVTILYLLCFVLIYGNTVKANEQSVRFVFTSFGAVSNVLLENPETGVCITLDSSQMFDYENTDFIYPDTKEFRVTKTFMDGSVVTQSFNDSGKKTVVGVYDDGVQAESWLEVNGDIVY